MRWSIVRVIWVRELRDQLRDRRTIFMIAVLPILLYPLGGLGLVEITAGLGPSPQVVGVYGIENLPPSGEAESPDSIPPLFVNGPNGWQIPSAYFDQADDQKPPVIRPLSSAAVGADLQALTDAPTGEALAPYRKPLLDHSVDLVVIVPQKFDERLRNGNDPARFGSDNRPALFVLDRDNDDHSRAVSIRFTSVLIRWKKTVARNRLVHNTLPADFDDPFRIDDDPERTKQPTQRAMKELVAMLLRILPFILVMWSLAGALYPAVDLCAGEKERGTMETLLISPASREEIVWGKFLTIWVFSAATALLNLVSMGLTAWNLAGLLPPAAFRPDMLFWSVLLVLPLSAFFSALSLAVGAYARSTKEGQYYLMPLFLLTLPLVCLTMAPGVELNPFYSMVPVTGVALLLQRLISPDPQSGFPWLYFLPVLAPMVIYSWLALRWAVGQFQREEVLFREAERLDVGLWLRRLFRDKEALPTAGQAFFCFALLLVLRWLSLGFGRDRNWLGLTAVCQLAFTAAPPLFMALLLTTRPRQGLALRLPPWWSWPAAALLAVLCVPPLAGLTMVILDQFPKLRQLLQENNTLTAALQSGSGLTSGYRFLLVLVLAVLPALCEELAFRGFILSGLRRRFRPLTAVCLSSFLFALFQVNVFQFAPHFVFGVVLSLIVIRTGSVAPAMVFHLVYNLCIIAPLVLPEAFGDVNRMENGLGLPALAWTALAAGCALLAAGLMTALLLVGKRPPTGDAAASLPQKPDSPLTAAADGAAAEAIKQAP